VTHRDWSLLLLSTAALRCCSHSLHSNVCRCY